MMEWSDAEAAEKACKGNTEGFRILVERHGRAIYRLAYRIAGNEPDAEDVVQETFLRAYKQLDRFDGRAAFSTWLHRICINCSLDFIRIRKGRQEQTKFPSFRMEDHNGGLNGLDLVKSREPSPERLTFSGEVQELLEPAMRQLSDMERAAFVLRHFEGCEIAEIAGALGVEGNAAKQTVFRAVRKLRRALQPALGALR